MLEYTKQLTDQSNNKVPKWCHLFKDGFSVPSTGICICSKEWGVHFYLGNAVFVNILICFSDIKSWFYRTLHLKNKKRKQSVFDVMPEKHTALAFHGLSFSTSYIFFLSREISADCYAKEFCVSVWLGRQLLVLMRSASITVFPLIETHGGSRMFQIRQWCVVRRYHTVSWKYMLGCSPRQDKWVLLEFGRVWSFSSERL